MACLGSVRVPVVLHCFEGGDREVREATERGYYVGLAGNVTYKNSETARVLRLHRRGPDPRRDRRPVPEPPARARHEERARRTSSHTARFVAERLGIEDEELATLTTRNARNLFGLPLEV